MTLHVVIARNEATARKHVRHALPLDLHAVATLSLAITDFIIKSKKMTKISIIALFIAIFSLATSAQAQTLTGTWQFNGGIYNGKRDTASLQYTMRRVYTSKNFNAYASQKGYKTERYEAGNYRLKGDTCFETQTYSSRPSQAMGKTIAYLYAIKNNELILSGTLPSGMVVEEHWKKVITPIKKR
jgi:hypothetical protein